MAADPKKVDRTGQRIGDIEVLYDSGRRTKKCEILWVTRNVVTGEERLRKSTALSKQARRLGVPRP